MLTVIMPSFHSAPLVEKRITEVDQNIPIIIIENSKNISFKSRVETKFKNVKVIIPEENLGWGKAINLGIKQSKTQFVFITQPDVKLIDNCVNKLIDCIKNFKDFALITPEDTNNEIYKNYETENNSTHEPKNNDYQLKEVEYVDLTWLINRTNFDDHDLWDEKIFLYFEAKDFSKRIRERNKKIYIAKGIKTFHIGSSSHESKFDYYSKLNRCWHYNWSRHYYYKKHYGFFFAYRKSLTLLLKLIIRLFKNLISLRNSQLRYNLIELYGLSSSMVNLPAFYRPYKKLKI